MKKNGHRIIALIVIMTVMIAAVALAYAAEENLVFVDSQNTNFRMYTQTKDGRFFVLGERIGDFTKWISLVNPSGKAVWTFSGDKDGFHSLAFAMNDKVYLCAEDYGDLTDVQLVPIIPVSISGNTEAPILLPHWTCSAPYTATESNVLFYDRIYIDGKHFFRIALYDASFNLAWEVTEPEKTFPFELLLNCLQTEDGFLLLGNNDKKKTAGIVMYDLNGRLAWKKTYKLNAYARDFALYGDKIIILADRLNAIKEHGSEFLFCVDQKGKILWERKLTESDGAVTLESIVPTPNGYVLAGSRTDEGRQNYVCLLTLDAECNMLDIVDIPYIKDMWSRVKYTDDGKLTVFGINRNYAGVAGGIVVYEQFDMEDAWLNRII